MIILWLSMISQGTLNGRVRQGEGRTEWVSRKIRSLLMNPVMLLLWVPSTPTRSILIRREFLEITFAKMLLWCSIIPAALLFGRIALSGLTIRLAGLRRRIGIIIFMS